MSYLASISDLKCYNQEHGGPVAEIECFTDFCVNATDAASSVAKTCAYPEIVDQ